MSCSHEEEIRAELPFSLCLPANEIYMPTNSPRRAMGDPGGKEQFALPAYAYILLLRDRGAGWEVYRCIEETLTAEDWIQDVYGGIYETDGNIIYRCTKRIEVLMNDNKGVDQRVYAVASSVPLTFSKTFSTSAISTLDDVLNLKIDMSSKSTREEVANIYSTPYNYNRPGTSSYYCSFTAPKASGIASVDLLLYHIASKVDITWRVAEEKRKNKDHPEDVVRLTKMRACNLYTGDVYCFKPLENVAASILTTSDTIDLVSSSCEGQWWEGRLYFYTIPYTVTGDPGYFPLQMLLETNESGAFYRPIYKMQINTSSPFAPWLRANFNISQKLVSDTETITVNNE
ncbi:MAG: hypothetical protein IKQ50_06900 [Paludibacteraceae bacterium]|nr:hypothetical protein [Paludibacteraceae bacterium]